jgi:hypothetical protein
MPIAERPPSDMTRVLFPSVFNASSCLRSTSNLILGNNEAAIEWALRSQATFNDWVFTYIALTCAYTNLDRPDEAQAMLKRVRELSPHLTIQLIIEGAAKYDAFADAVGPPLRKARLPEG